MQTSTTSISSRNAHFHGLHTANEPIGHIDFTIPVRSDYSLPHPPPDSQQKEKRRNPKQPEVPAPSGEHDHAIDDYA